jgi:hypothetical protein
MGDLCDGRHRFVNASPHMLRHIDGTQFGHKVSAMFRSPARRKLNDTLIIVGLILTTAVSALAATAMM